MSIGTEDAEATLQLARAIERLAESIEKLSEVKTSRAEHNPEHEERSRKQFFGTVAECLK